MALFKYDATNHKLIPITSEGSVGIPVGAVMGFAKGAENPNWLLCDGRDTTGTAEELRTHYPALYTYLGNSNVLPDYRECTLVGVGENTTDTIAAHDVYTLGEFKDDQLQNITGYVNIGSGVSNLGSSGALNNSTGSREGGWGSNGGNWGGVATNHVSFDASRVARTDTTTHGKQKGIAFYIKATSAGIEVDKDLYATKGYIRDQNILSDYESISWTNTAAGAFEMQYDGVFCSGNGAAEGVNFMVSSDGGTSWTRVVGCGGGGQPGTWQGSGAQILLQKGWKVYAVLNNLSAEGGLPNLGSVAYYKLRDYTGR